MLDYLKNKKIGIWGWGVAGKSVGRYLSKEPTIHLSVFDARELPQSEVALSETSLSEISLFSGTLHDFLDTNDFIFPSPGIDLRAYSRFSHKWLSELDLFSAAWHIASIGITGTIGKTSLTTLLSQTLAAAGVRNVTGGNIGVGLLDMLHEQKLVDYAVLELSSYQLERSTHYAPTIAILTNLYPNHLDRHGTLEEYFSAKYTLFAYQRDTQAALVPLELSEKFRERTERPLIFFSSAPPTSEQKKQLLPQDIVYYFDESNGIWRYKARQSEMLFSSTERVIPSLSYPTNWLIIIAALTALGKNREEIKKNLTETSFVLPQHRGELVMSKHGVEYYDDSKSTIFESTLAAVERLSDAPVILLLGGLSKGVDRIQLIPQLVGKVIFIACFGAEAPVLYAACVQQKIPASCNATLQEAFQSAHRQAKIGCRVLLSPAGTSFDLFKNYQERGEAFCALVKNL